MGGFSQMRAGLFPATHGFFSQQFLMSPDTPIHTWHIAISGFTQDSGEGHGVAKMYRERLLQFDRIGAQVLLKPWTVDVVALANHIAMLSRAAPRANLYAYSWGCPTSMALARELGDRGIPIHRAVLCDPVYRSPWWLVRWRSLMPPRLPRFNTFTRSGRLASWLASGAYYAGRVAPWLLPKIDVPSTVRRVTAFRQSISIPMAHDLRLEDPRLTKLDPILEANVDHSRMDDLIFWHKECEQAAAEIAA